MYDGSPLEVFDDFASGKLGSLPLPSPEDPRIALVAGENTRFRLSDGNKQMPSIDEFLTPFDIVDAASNSPLSPDFLVMLMPPALLHHSTIGRFTKSIFKLLERRFSVHIRLYSLQDHGLSQERSTILVVASPFCAALPWSIGQPINGPRPWVEVKGLIGDLAFENPRATQGAKGGFVCSVPAQNKPVSDEGNGRPLYIYNHQTGRSAPLGEDPIDMSANAIPLYYDSPKSLVHPSKSFRVFGSFPV